MFEWKFEIRWLCRKTATNVCKKITPSSETRSAVVNTVTDYGRKLIPNEATKQKVSRFYESQVAKLKYAQLKEGYQPSDREDLDKFADDDDFYGMRSDHQVPEDTTFTPISPARITPSSEKMKHSQSADWNGSFIQFKEPGKRF